jgi:hypothetical protein
VRSRRTDPEVLRARCEAAARMVEMHAAAHARATERALAAPDDRASFELLETAEELHYLAVYELRRARRALRRREAFDALVARWTPAPLPRGARRR